MNTKMTAALQLLQSLVGIAGSNLATAANLITIPVTGGALAGPSFSAAAVAIISMPNAIANLVSAINAFEGNQDSYLSKKNKCD
jgi:hypothetical protein